MDYITAFNMIKQRLIDKDADTRMAVCLHCPHLNRFKICERCKCFMPAKTRIKETVCPVGKW